MNNFRNVFLFIEKRGYRQEECHEQMDLIPIVGAKWSGRMLLSERFTGFEDEVGRENPSIGTLYRF
jgi:hypothetical protein